MGFDWITREDGNIRIAGGARGFDDLGHDTFEIQLPTKPGLYGEFRRRFSDSQNDFDIEIVNFGFLSEGNVGNPYPGARQVFSTMERDLIESLIEELFASEKARNGIAIFMSKKGRFLGKVHFASGWIVVKPGN